MNLILFVMAALALNAGFSHLIDAREPGLLEGDAGEKISVVFIGSSLMLAIDPARFDRAMLDRGYAIESANLGELSAFGHETAYRIRSLLADRPPSLKFLFVEANALNNMHWNTIHGTRRELESHDLNQTIDAIRLILLTDAAWDSKQGRIVRHLKLCFQKYAVAGKAMKLLPGRDGEPASAGERDRKADRPAGPEERQRARAKLHPAEYARSLRELKTDLRRPYTASPVTEIQASAFRRQVGRIRRRRVTPLYIAHPSFHHEPGLLRELDRRGIFPEVFYFDDPARYPRFFEPEARQDRYHLDEAASRDYTRLVAEKFADYLDRNPEQAATVKMTDPANS